MAHAVEAPPLTPVEPVIEILHGVEITDPYRWLEDQESPRTREWLAQQTAYARAYLDSVPSRELIRQRVRQLLSVELVSEPWKAANHYFYMKRLPDEQQPAIVMRELGSTEEIALVSPSERDHTGALSVNILSISRDGSLLAYGVKNGGTDFQSVEFLDVPRRAILCDRLPVGLWPNVFFSEDGKSFYFSQEPVNASGSPNRAIYCHSFGTTPGEDEEVFHAGNSRDCHVYACMTGDPTILGILVVTSNDPVTFDAYVKDLRDACAPRQLLKEATSLFRPFFVGSTLLAITNRGKSNRQIVAIDLGNHYRDVVPESSDRIKDFTVVDDFVCVSYIRDDLSNMIELYDLFGHRRGSVSCPGGGTIQLLRRPADCDMLFYTFTSFAQPPVLFSYHPRSGACSQWAAVKPPVDSSSIELKRVTYRSKDGTEIPMSLIHKKGARLSATTPAFITAYGGFGTSVTPQFGAYSTFLVENGVLIVVLNLRGGGEFGDEWHASGKRHNRHNPIDDFIAAAEWLVERKYTTPERIAIGGGSNAGLLVGAVLTRRPELFRAAIVLGPLLDMVRYHLFGYARSWISEYGSSANSEDFRHLLDCSPYHCVTQGTSYPAVLIISGDADTCCDPMHARKMTARLQASTVSEHPILLDYKPSRGHQPVQPLNSRIDALTDKLAFLCHEIGITGLEDT
jgi:prolyl oligopeptidase